MMTQVKVDNLTINRFKEYKSMDMVFFGQESCGKTTISKLLDIKKKVNLKNFIVDGENVTNCEYGVMCNLNFETLNEMKIEVDVKNISNTDSTKSANGIVFYKNSSETTFLNPKLTIKSNVETSVKKLLDEIRRNSNA